MQCNAMQCDAGSILERYTEPALEEGAEKMVVVWLMNAAAGLRGWQRCMSMG